MSQAQDGTGRAVGRLLTAVERGGDRAEQVTELTWKRGRGAHVVGITGPPGAGKSTLVGQMIVAASASGKRPAILAIDPSSPLSGGAILGDRIRMDDIAPEGTFIRSMATRGHQGGLSIAVPGAIRVLDCAGFDPVIVETVGVGQVEVDVVTATDTAVVVMTPGMGDAVQANKAGLLEVADVFVVNKADRPGASDTRRDLEIMLDLTHITKPDDTTPRPEIIMTTATSGDGVTEVWEAVLRHRQAMDGLEDSSRVAPTVRRRRRAAQELRHRLEQAAIADIDALLSSQTGAEIVDQIMAGHVSPPAAMHTMRERLTNGDSGLRG